MPLRWETIEPLLMQVTKPARYVGGEFNQVIKPSARVSCCLAFPDLYEIGMSYHGYRILYERINEHEAWAAERTFAPWTDFEVLMRREGVPLYSLETRRSLREFDWIGFTLQHESNLTNILNMIDLAGLALESKDRGDSDPILIGGGEGAYSPEPIAPFLDALVLGDGETVVLELMALFERAKDQDGVRIWDRTRMLRELARIPGVYIPAFFEFDYHEDGRIAAIRSLQPAGEDAPLPSIIHRRYDDIAGDLGSTRPVVPLMRTVHDRLTIEIRRGCVNGCRFCQAGMINRPVHERPVNQILEITRRGLDSTGYDEVSLLSLSSADYTMISPLIARLGCEFGTQGVSVSLPSLRINGFDISLVDQLAAGRKSGFTFAPEAGTERLRQVINKPVDQEFFFEMIEEVFRRGWQTIKFYFMIGLPTETAEDLDGIVQICERAAELGWRYHKKRAAINVTLSPFVPKSNTPFQWEAQLPREELERRYHYVRRAVRERVGPKIDIKSADTGMSYIEAVLARGDRRMAPALRRAWELGARFDGWADHFKLDLWLKAFEDVGLDPAFYANRERAEDEIFPFDHLSSDVGRRFLWADRCRAQSELAMGKCDTGNCVGCDVCNDERNHTLARNMEHSSDSEPPPQNPKTPAATGPEPEEPSEPFRAMEAPKRPLVKGAAAHVSAPPVQRIRVTFTKLDALRYLSHLDFAKVMGMILRRVGIPLAYTHGFNPLPRVQYAPPLSLGMGGECEPVDLMLIRPMSPETVLRALNEIELAGLTYLGAEEIPLRSDSLEVQIAASIYRVEFTRTQPEITRATLEDCIAQFIGKPEWIVTLQKKNGERQVDLKQSIRTIELGEPADGWSIPWPSLKLAIEHEPGLFVKPHEAAGFLLGRPIELGCDVRVSRTGFHFCDCVRDASLR